MSAIVNINGNEIKEKNGVFWINGKKVINNQVDNSIGKAPAFFSGFIAGVLFLIAIAELGKAI